MAKYICISMNLSNPNFCSISGCSGIFGDVPNSNPFCSYIEALYNDGVVGGCQSIPMLYCPNSFTQRQQMAKFLCTAMNAINPDSCLISGCLGIFNDVPSSNPFCSYIEALYNNGIVGGCAPSYYCPSANVSREQMAKFIINAFNF